MGMPEDGILQCIHMPPLRVMVHSRRGMGAFTATWLSRCPCAQGRHWVLDPIDGTRGFVGQRQYAVCLGLLDEGKVRPEL